MKIITSKQNPEIKALCALHHNKYRASEQKFLAEGQRTINTLMTRYNPIQLYMTEEVYAQQHGTYDETIITLVSHDIMTKISTTEHASGIMGLFNIPSTPNRALTKGLVLANINNPGNMGTLIRTAAAMNCRTIVIVEGVDPWHPKVIQATAGTIALIDIFELSWSELLHKKNKLRLCGLVINDGQESNVLRNNDLLLVVGNEATGIPDQWLADCELTCTLAMPGETESLNAAVAGAIALYIAFSPK